MTKHPAMLNVEHSSWMGPFHRHSLHIVFLLTWMLQNPSQIGPHHELTDTCHHIMGHYSIDVSSANQGGGLTLPWREHPPLSHEDYLAWTQTPCSQQNYVVLPTIANCKACLEPFFKIVFFIFLFYKNKKTVDLTVFLLFLKIIFKK